MKSNDHVQFQANDSRPFASPLYHGKGQIFPVNNIIMKFHSRHTQKILCLAQSEADLIHSVTIKLFSNYDSPTVSQNFIDCNNKQA